MHPIRVLDQLQVHKIYSFFPTSDVDRHGINCLGYGVSMTARASKLFLLGARTLIVGSYPCYRRLNQVKDMVIKKMRKFIYLGGAVQSLIREIAQDRGVLY